MHLLFAYWGCNKLCSLNLFACVCHKELLTTCIAVPVQSFFFSFKTPKVFDSFLDWFCNEVSYKTCKKHFLSIAEKDTDSVMSLCDCLLSSSLLVLYQ